MSTTSKESPALRLPANIRLVCAPAASPEHPESVPHILLTIDQFAATLGGGERILLRLAHLLPQHGFRVSILTFFVDATSPILGAAPPCPVYLLPLSRTWDLRALKAARHLRKFLITQRVRIVHTFFESSDLWAGSVAKTVPGLRLIWSRRDMGILRTAKHRLAYRLLSHLPDLVFAVSEQVRAHCIEADGVPANRVKTLYNGVDLLPTHRPASAHETVAPMILAVGNIRRVKGFDVLLEVAALVVRSQPHVHFAIAGEVLEPIYFASLKDRCKELGLGERFHFLGGISAIAEELEAASIFVSPSRSEGFSNAIIEAMAASLPVVATDVGGNAEAVEDGVTGLIVPPDNAPALASALNELLKDPTDARRMGIAGRDKCERMFSTSAMMTALASAYQNLLGQ